MDKSSCMDLDSGKEHHLPACINVPGREGCRQLPLEPSNYLVSFGGLSELIRMPSGADV